MTTIEERTDTSHEIDTLRARCDELGIEYHHRHKAETLVGLIASHESGETKEEVHDGPTISEIDDVMPDGPRKPKTEEAGKKKEKGHPCGLPPELMSKKAIVHYCDLHGLSQDEWGEIELTPHERTLFDAYKKTAGVTGANRRHFVAAVRLWKNGYPLELSKRVHINTMKIERKDAAK